MRFRPHRACELNYHLFFPHDYLVFVSISFDVAFVRRKTHNRKLPFP
jgi:hypothetical protein